MSLLRALASIGKVTIDGGIDYGKLTLTEIKHGCAGDDDADADDAIVAGNWEETKQVILRLESAKESESCAYMGDGTIDAVLTTESKGTPAYIEITLSLEDSDITQQFEPREMRMFAETLIEMCDLADGGWQAVEGVK